MPEAEEFVAFRMSQVSMQIVDESFLKGTNVLDAFAGGDHAISVTRNGLYRRIFYIQHYWQRTCTPQTNLDVWLQRNSLSLDKQLFYFKLNSILFCVGLVLLEW